MRDAFLGSLFELFQEDSRALLLTSDTGAIVMDRFRSELPGRCVNVGIAEENMIGVAAGLAMTGRTVYVYAIAPFATMRCFEQIRVDVCVQNLPVKIIGIGAGIDYSTLGPTHHGAEDIALMRALPGMVVLSPCDNVAASALASVAHGIPGPVYIRLDRAGLPLVYGDGQQDFSAGASILRSGGHICIFVTGRMVHNALQVAEALSQRAIEATVVDLFRIKPLNEELVLRAVGNSRLVVTLEEHNVIGGIGSAIAEVLAEKGLGCRLRRFGLPDRFCRDYGSRDYLQGLLGLDAPSLTEAIAKAVDS